MTELGETHDPLALVPGVPAGIRDNARILRARAEYAERAGDALVDIGTGGWTGAAADAFRERFSYEPNKWYAAANSLSTAADVLTTFTDTLEWAQEQAAEAIRLWDAAPSNSDAGEAGRQAAGDTLRNARDQVARAGDAAARFLNREADAAPLESSWLDRLGGFVQDAGADVVNGLASFGNAMIHHPGETATLAGGLLLTAVSATGDGLGFALDATGVGVVAGAPLNAVSTAGVVTGATLTGSAATSLMRHAAGDDAVSPMSGSPPARSVPTKTDRMKEHLTERDLDAARRELNGEVVATKPSGQPWDHVDEVRNAQRGLVRRIGQLKRLLGDARVPAAERAAYESELSEASRLLDHSEQYVPRG